MTLRRCVQGIPTDYDGARPLIRDEPEQEVGEADYGARALAVAAGGASVLTIEGFLRQKAANRAPAA